MSPRSPVVLPRRKPPSAVFDAVTHPKENIPRLTKQDALPVSELTVSKHWLGSPASVLPSPVSVLSDNSHSSFIDFLPASTLCLVSSSQIPYWLTLSLTMCSHINIVDPRVFQVNINLKLIVCLWSCKFYWQSVSLRSMLNTVELLLCHVTL